MPIYKNFDDKRMDFISVHWVFDQSIPLTYMYNLGKLNIRLILY